MTNPFAQLELEIVRQVLGRSDAAWVEAAEAVVVGTEYAPKYARDMGAAWIVHVELGKRLFSIRQRYYARLTELIQNRMGFPVAWPDALGFVVPSDICEAALYAVAAALTIEDYRAVGDEIESVLRTSHVLVKAGMPGGAVPGTINVPIDFLERWARQLKGRP